MEYKQYKFDSFRILTVKTDQFKNCHIEINFVSDAEKVNIPLRTFLTNIMEYSTQKYQSRRELLIALEELYNSEFNCTTTRIGKSLFSTFSLDFINPQYVNDKKYLEQCVNFLCEVVLKPNINNEQFSEKAIQIIKERLHMNIDKYKEDALDYAILDSHEKLFADSFIKQRIIGTHEDIDNITNKLIYQDYLEMLKNSTVDILISGDLEMDKIVKLFQKHFHKKSIVEKEYLYNSNPTIKPLIEMEVQKNYVQTQLLMYIQYKDLTFFEANVVLNVYLQILGNANYTDKLGTYLRKENSLCYYRGINLRKSDNYFVIYTGLNHKNVTKAKEMIFKALKEMEKGIIDEQYFEKQKEKMISNIIMGEDSQSQILDNYYFHVLFGKLLTDKLKEEIAKVTIEDIKKLAKKLKLTMIYVLKEGIANEED